ncbi:MAG: hypothetical protein HRF51_08820 [bacterium]|jgi:hypothetical protein
MRRLEKDRYRKHIPLFVSTMKTDEPVFLLLDLFTPDAIVAVVSILIRIEFASCRTGQL